MTPEGKVKDKLKKELHAMGILNTMDMVRALKRTDEDNSNVVGWYFMPAGTGMGEAGISDFVMCVMGNYIEVETKAKGKKPTKLQALHGDVVAYALGEWHCVAGELGVDEFIQYLKELVNGEILSRQIANTAMMDLAEREKNLSVKH